MQDLKLIDFHQVNVDLTEDMSTLKANVEELINSYLFGIMRTTISIKVVTL